MNPTIDAISQLTKLGSDNLSDANTSSVSVYDKNFSSMVSSAFSKVNDTDMQYKDVINAMSQSPHFTSNPEKLAQLQEYLGEYTNYVSLVSTLAHKATSTVETLEKAQ